MSNNDEQFEQQQERNRISRRLFLGGAGAVGAMGAASMLGGIAGGAVRDSKQSALDQLRRPAIAGGALTAAEIATLKKMVGPIDPKYSGKGKTMKIGGAWALTGPLVYYFTIQGDGLKLAAQHIEAMGGPKIDLSVQNVGSAEGVNSLLAEDVALAWKSDGVGTAVTFDYDAGGSLIPFVQKDKIFSIDAGAGVGSFGGENYFWGFRGIYPQNYLMQGCVYLKDKNPSYKTVSIVYYTGGQYTGLNTDIQAQIESAGFTVVGNANTEEGATDFSGAIATLRSQNADIVVLGSSGNDAAYFLKDYQVSGLTAPVVGDSFSGPEATVGGTAFNGTYVVQENFLPDNPSNDWGKIFVKHYRAAYGNQGSSQANSPLNLSASYYNVGFVLWELARRVLAKGGDINDGEQIQAALLEHLSFPTIFGGHGTTPGVARFDTSTHGLSHEPIGIFQVVNNGLKLVGSADSAGGPVTVVA
jgi:ABC-type branched-subunit amino acid transport system substrate-binding protein